MASSLTSLTYYYEQKPGTSGLNANHYRKIERAIKLRVDPCTIVCTRAPEGVCKMYRLTICGEKRDWLLDETQITPFML